MDRPARAVSTVRDQTQPRYRPFGVFRFGLALLVVLQHFQHLLPEPDRVFFHRLGLGAVAVALFFAVSGFVVTEANDAFYRGRPGAFLANRVLRLAPPYYAALILAVAVQAALWGTGRLALWDFSLRGSPLDPRLLLGGVLALIPGFHTRYISENFEFIPFVWSLRVEMAFYLAAAGVFALARAWPGRQILAWSVSGALVACGIFLEGGKPGLLSTGPMFLAGVAWRGVAQGEKWGRWLLAPSLVLAAVGFASWDQHGYPVLAGQLGLLAALFALFAGLSRAATRPAWQRWDQRLGDLSYPLYLNHYAIGIALFDLSPARAWAVYALGVTLSVLLAVAMGQGVDRPLRHLRNRLRRTTL